MDRLDKLTSSGNFQELLENLEKTIPAPEDPTDLPPEYCTYQDEGCELAPSCLNCPYPHCILDLPAGQDSFNKHYRDQAIRNGYYRRRQSVSDLVKQFGVSERTVRRALKAVIQ